jgi:hypothetical protein
MAHEQWIRQTERGQAAEAIEVAHAPDFVRHNRGPEDEHWAHPFGAQCARCGHLMEEGDFARRRGDGSWVHERCPVRLPVVDPADD